MVCFKLNRFEWSVCDFIQHAQEKNFTSKFSFLGKDVKCDMLNMKLVNIHDRDIYLESNHPFRSIQLSSLSKQTTFINLFCVMPIGDSIFELWRVAMVLLQDEDVVVRETMAQFVLQSKRHLSEEHRGRSAWHLACWIGWKKLHYIPNNKS